MVQYAFVKKLFICLFKGAPIRNQGTKQEYHAADERHRRDKRPLTQKIL